MNDQLKQVLHNDCIKSINQSIEEGAAMVRANALVCVSLCICCVLTYMCV